MKQLVITDNYIGIYVAKISGVKVKLMEESKSRRTMKG